MSVGSDSTTSEASIEVKENLSRKRKHDAAGKDPPAKPTSARKRRARVEDDSFDLVAGINLEFSNMDSQLLADYVAKRTRDFERDLSLVELEDKYIPGRRCYIPGPWVYRDCISQFYSHFGPRHIVLGGDPPFGEPPFFSSSLLYGARKARIIVKEEWSPSHHCCRCCWLESS